MQKEMGALALPRPLLEGSLRRLPIPDLLQSLTHGDPCQVLFVAGDNVRGFVWLAGRRLVRARTLKQDGRTAFFELVGAGPVGGFRVFSLPPERVPEPEVENVGEVSALLLDAVIAMDHERRQEEDQMKARLRFQHKGGISIGVADVADPCRTLPLGVHLTRLLEGENA